MKRFTIFLIIGIIAGILITNIPIDYVTEEKQGSGVIVEMHITGNVASWIVDSVKGRIK